MPFWLVLREGRRTTVKKSKEKKSRKIGIKPLHPIASFPSVRKRIDILTRFHICLTDLFPPGVNLTANESKVLFVMRAAAIGRTNIAAIDQEKIAEISGIRQPHVARAIAGLRRKNLIKQTWMEAGLQMYRNIYELWAPPELIEKDANTMVNQKRRAKTLERKADALTEQSNVEAAALKEKAKEAFSNICNFCSGDGAALVYVRNEDRERLRLCVCSIGRKKALKIGGFAGDFVPDEMMDKFKGQSN
jgi:predicted transcriptional regulator